MQLAYGSYQFPSNATELASSIVTKWNSGGQPFAQEVSLSVNGHLLADGQDALSQAQSALQSALAVPFQDLKFLGDDGTVTASSLVNAGSITGVRIHDLEFPVTQGPEFVTIRSFRFKASAEYPLANSAALLLEYHETLEFSGGGPIYRFRLAINGFPQKQLVYPASPYRVVQSGRAVGYRVYPRVATPKFPGSLMEAPTITQESPTRQQFGKYQGFPTTWRYHFESASPIIAFPTLWIS